ncbi:hypothetical protein [Acidovorax sp. LjRoot194]|uniref:hypothetical protein n=1 Tax=Acidovorax sp. LjRoot194 TaxID=3342280 RepID=UPI003ED02579
MIGQGGISAEGGSSVTVNALDGEVINRMFDFAGKQSGQVYDFGGRALDLTSDVVNEALGFGSGAMKLAANAQSDALAFAESTNKTAQQNSYNFAGDALGGALGLATSAMNKAFNSAEYTGSMVKDAYADAKGRGALTDKILIGAVLAMAVVAFAAVKK